MEVQDFINQAINWMSPEKEKLKKLQDHHKYMDLIPTYFYFLQLIKQFPFLILNIFVLLINSLLDWSKDVKLFHSSITWAKKKNKMNDFQFECSTLRQEIHVQNYYAPLKFIWMVSTCHSLIKMILIPLLVLRD